MILEKRMERAVLVTATYYTSPNDIRFELALRTCDAACECGYQLLIVDGSPEAFVGELFRTRGASVLKQEEAGMGSSRREAIKAGLASGADTIIWLEPEKYPLVPLLQPCVDLIQGDDRYDIIIPARESLESLPYYQEVSELRMNRAIGFATGMPELDVAFGPRVMSRNAAELFLGYTGQAGGDTWHILCIPILWAIADRMRITSKRVNYIHPPKQTAAETGNAAMDRKRDHQRESMVASMDAEAKRLGIIGLQ